MSYSSVDLLERAARLLEEVAALPLAGVPDEELCAITAQAARVERFVAAVGTVAAAEIVERSRFELGSDGLSYRLGHRRGIHLVEDITRVAQTEAARRIRLGTAIRSRSTLDGRPLPAQFPHVAAAVTSGTMAMDAAAAVIRCLSQAAANGAEPEHLDAAEADLVAASAHEPADSVAVMARAWREALDPDGAQPREEQLRERRGFTLGREHNGMTPFWGAADPISAARLKAAFAESTAPDAAPRFLDDPDAERAATLASADGDIVVRVSDPRTPAQRRLDILLGLLTAGIRSTGQRSTAAVAAVVLLSDLQKGEGVGWLDDVAEPVSIETIRELACDAGFYRVLLGNDGEVLAEGLRERYFTPAQRRALAVSDGGCVWPGCNAPPSWCHAHHVVPWAEGGKTDIENGVLLCPAHHHMLHNSPFTMKMINGRPHLLAPPWLDPAGDWRVLGKSRIRRMRYRRAA
jgi:hypothetical protein